MAVFPTATGPGPGRVILGTAVLIAAVVASAAAPLVVATVPRQPVDPATAQQGKAHYEQYCVLCHGESVVGYANDNATAIGNPAFLAIASDELIIAGISRGRPGSPHRRAG